MIFPNSNKITLFLQKHNIQTRPNAGHGLWVMFLLPLALIVSDAANPVTSTSVYKLSSIFAVGLICSCLVFLYESSQSKRLNFLNIWLIAACCIVTALFQVCLHRGVLFSFWSAIVSTLLFHKFYLWGLEKLPNCFTLGEAALCSQSYILLFYFTPINIFNHATKPTTSVIQISTLIIQVGLIGLSTIIILAYLFQITSPVKFYALTTSVVVFVIILPLQILLSTNLILWVLNLFWEDLQMSKVILYWTFCTVVAVFAVSSRIKKAKKASTTIRKTFHFLIVSVFIPGLLYNCSLLYLASGVVLGIFFMLETLRVMNMPPLGESLQNGYVVFGDEKDMGIIAFTPMYLLAGCSLPIWIHPAPCDVTNSAIFNLLPLLSGVLTIGIGDTAASIIGSRFGTHRWKGSNKTIEGTIACVVSQLAIIFAFVYLGFVKLSSIEGQVKTILAVITASMIEAKTDQVDNLVMPFIMYTILIV